MPDKLKIAILISGGGTTFQYIQEQINAGHIAAETVAVISSRADAFGITRAAGFGIPTHVVSRKEFTRNFPEDPLVHFNRAILDTLAPYQPQLIVLAGFMSLLSPEFVSQYPNRIINTHPALVPSFCGDGYYGDRVHKAVVTHGVKVTGCTIHFVNETYDDGPIIIQRAVPVLHTDTWQDISARVQAAEKPAYCEAIKLISENRVSVIGRVVHIADSPA